VIFSEYFDFFINKTDRSHINYIVFKVDIKLT